RGRNPRLNGEAGDGEEEVAGHLSIRAPRYSLYFAFVIAHRLDLLLLVTRSARLGCTVNQTDDVHTVSGEVATYHESHPFPRLDTELVGVSDYRLRVLWYLHGPNQPGGSF